MNKARARASRMKRESILWTYLEAKELTLKRKSNNILKRRLRAELGDMEARLRDQEYWMGVCAGDKDKDRRYLLKGKRKFSPLYLMRRMRLILEEILRREGKIFAAVEECFREMWSQVEALNPGWERAVAEEYEMRTVGGSGVTDEVRKALALAEEKKRKKEVDRVTAEVELRA